ncbi:MAG: decaprenyl-phosphate phosphoribosyltransferase [Acidimicrobiales bacterium]
MVSVSTSDATGGSVVAGLLRTARPRQWTKNVLVVAAPLAAGELFEPDVLIDTAIAFVCFWVAASGIYLVNDACDVEEDRRHPTKQHRPVAAGVVAVRIALGAGLGLVVAGTALGFMARWELAALIGVYAGLQLAYCFGLKHQAVVDLAVVSSGFLLRAMAGGVAAGLVISQWFLLVTGFGSLFMVAGKRYSELHELGEAAGGTRRSLTRYSDSYLRFVWSVSAGVSLVVYSLWAFEISGEGPWAPLSIAPFTLALLRYAVDIDAGAAGEPEDIVLNDRVLQLLALLWLGLIALEVFGG